MKTIVKLLMLIGAPLLLVKPVKSQNSQPVSEFSKLKLDANVSVELVIADRYSVYMENNQAKAPSVNNGELVLDDEFASSGKIKVFVKNLKSVTMDGASRLECLDTLRVNDFTIEMDAAARAHLIVAGSNTLIKMDGGSYLELEGNTNNATVDLDGAANFKAGNFLVKSMTINTDGGSRAKVNVSENFAAKSDGASLVNYVGEPKNKTISLDGLAKITKDDKEEFTAENGIADLPAIADLPDGDTTRVKIGKRKFIIIDDDKKEEAKKEKDENDKRRMKRVYAGFELGVNAMTTSDMNFSHPDKYKFLNTKVGSSWFYGLNLFEVDGHIIKNKLALTTGLGMQFSNYHFEGNTYITPNVDSLSGTDAGVALSTNRLYTYDLNAPLMIKFAPGNKKKANKGFHIAVGAIVRYQATAKVVTETSANGYEQKTSYKDDFNMNAFRVDGTVRVGYDRVKLFVNYSLTPYFKGNNDPDIRTFAAGLTLIGF